ncbi:hypothetical protein [Croceicoccus mobilis]|nr:hypothetical protein [Croceicoccus mobilis]
MKIPGNRHDDYRPDEIMQAAFIAFCLCVIALASPLVAAILL